MTLKKDKRKTRILTLCTSLLLLNNSASAQLHSPSLPQNRTLVIAEEQFMQQHYKNAAASSTAFLSQHQYVANTQSYNVKEKAEYILVTSLLKINDAGAVNKAENFIKTTSNPAYKQRVAYALAQNYFSNNKYSQALPYYELASFANLDNDEIIQAKFELAYCYFSNSMFNQAEPLLASVRELGGKYYDAGNYYYGLLAYNRSNYKDALTSFKRIDDKAEYSNLVPYYIAEIYYFTGDKQKALAEATKLINKPEKSFYHKELHLLAAQIHFENQEYNDALPYFEYYYDNTDRIRKEDLYEMGYCYYKISNWEEAIESFQQLGETRDSLSQSSMYLLGECYLKIDDKKSARNAFSVCADMPYNAGQKEASMLLAAQLSYELGFYNDAIYYINLLLADFSASPHADEAKTLLSDLLIRTSNYAEAYSTLQDVANKNASYSRVSQKVGYGYAMQQIQNGNFGFADSLLTMSLAEGTDPTYKSAATFWKADMSYKLGEYKNTLIYGERFLKGNRGKEWVHFLSPAATDRNMYITLGYAAMELSEFDRAQNYFTKARVGVDSTDSTFIIATILREADAVFMQKNYKTALELYDQVIEANSPEADYANYQKAIIAGLDGNNKKKTVLLSELVNNTKSRYSNQARYELGLTFIEDNKYSSAVNTLLPLTQTIEMRNMAPKAWMKIGFAYQQASQPGKAIDAYKKIVSDYPTSEERPAALDALKSLYIQVGEPENYAKLLSDNSLVSNEENTLDSAYYATAENVYADNNWKQAKKLMGEYINKFPNGVFLVKAHYYKAESHYQLEEYKDALQGYDVVINSNWNSFSENSARKAATIEYEQGNLREAAGYYANLRNIALSQENLQIAYEGLMLSNYKMEQKEPASAYADTLLSMPGVNDDIINSARLIKGDALLSAGNIDEALDVFKKLTNSKIPATASEAKYNVAHIYYLQNKLDEAEEAANKTIKQQGVDEYWVVKSYILLADILVKNGDYFNAKATLQSIVKNCQIVSLKKEAYEKLGVVKRLESKQSKLSD